MKSVLNASLVIAVLALGIGCVEDGQSADCADGTRAEKEAAGCLTPIGGSCLTLNEFKEARPADGETEDGETINLEDDWVSYMEEREECCFSEEDFKTGRPATSVNDKGKTETLEESWLAHEAANCGASEAE